MKQKEFRHVLPLEKGNHNWKKNKCHAKSIFSDFRKNEYRSFTCKKCGMHSIKYVGGESFFVLPVAYSKEAVFNCPEELGTFVSPEHGALVVAFGSGEPIQLTRKKKLKEYKKLQRISKKENVVIITGNQIPKLKRAKKLKRKKR